MSIGKRNRQIEIWKPSGAVDGANQPLPDAWEPHARRWAHIKGETGMGAIRAAAQRDGVNTPLDRYSYRVAYSPSIDATMQLRERDGTRAQIIIVRHDKENRAWTDIVVEIGGANG